MKLCKLKLKNLNSFRSEEELDFEEPPLDDASLVAITGPTGAGKTTLLDAICVALYGKTPRLTGSGSQNPNHLISHGETEGFAEVHFIANGTRYIAAWSCKLNASPKVSLLNADSDELISEKLSKKGKSLGSSENTVSEEITSILGLDFAAFKRSVMLAQGEFAAFLKASSEDRRAILEATASIHIYDMLRQALNDKVNEVSDAYDETAKELDKIPESSIEQLAEAEAKLSRLQAEAEKLGVNNQQIQEQKEAETERKKDFGELQISETREKELTNQQPLIDELKSELEHADRANQLRPEKQAFDTAKSDHEKASEVVQRAASELSDAENQHEATQADFDKKEEIYADASTERDRKMEMYADAKLDVERAGERFTEVNKRTPKLEDLNEQIETISSQLSGKQTKQLELQEQIAAAQTFLDENRLPSDRDSRRIKLTKLQAQLNSQAQQLKDKSDTQSEHISKINELNEKLKKLSNNRDELRSEKAALTNSRAETEAEHKMLQDTGTLEEWQRRRDNAIKAQSIVQQYENSDSQLCEEKESLAEFQERIAKLDKSLDELAKKLEIQYQLCKRADAEVEKLEAEREIALLADPVNQLRHQLEPGQPCRVCGATDHPYADKVEHESEALLEGIEKALDDAETEAKKAQKQKQKLEQNQVRLQQDKSNTAEQVDECIEEIENLNTETADHCAKWQELYESADISSEWADERFNEANTALDNLNATQETYNEVSKKLNEVSHKLETCENNLKRESDLLDETKQKFDSVSSEIEDLKANVKDIEDSFWESMPEVFHGVTPDESVQQFGDKIEEVSLQEQKLTDKKGRLNVLNTEIQNNQDKLKGLKKNYQELEDEIEHYQSEGETFLDAVHKKTDDLETEDEIDTAIKKLEAELQAKENARDKAEKRLQESLNVLTRKQTAHGIGEEQLKESDAKLENARQTYFAKLEEAGFDSPEAHKTAFREEAQTQQITEQISEYTSEKKQLEVEIIALRTQFAEMPFDKEILVQISTQAEEIAAEIQGIQQKIGAQQTEIDRLKDALKKRQELDADVQVAKQEWERWKKLQDIIPRNELRDFALDIMFQQVSRIANVQLAYLTSDRYQLKVETIGKLTVIDRWNANEERPVETLSGGESFLTSLALALALSELSQGRAQLNSLFLDEGFGTLDAETLDIAIAALEGLRMQGRSIYLISHIQELTRRLPVKINIRKQGNGSSTFDIKD